MAIGRDRLSGLEEVANDGDRLRPVSQVLRCSAAGQDETVILLGLHLVQPEVGLHAIAGLLGVGVEARLEVVDHRKESPLLGSRDLNLPALFFQAELGVIDLLASPASPVSIRILSMENHSVDDLRLGIRFRDTLTRCPSGFNSLAFSPSELAAHSFGRPDRSLDPASPMRLHSSQIEPHGPVV